MAESPLDKVLRLSDGRVKDYYYRSEHGKRVHVREHASGKKSSGGKLGELQDLLHQAMGSAKQKMQELQSTSDPAKTQQLKKEAQRYADLADEIAAHIRKVITEGKRRSGNA